MKQSVQRAAPLWLSDPIPLPVSRVDGTPAEVHVIYNMAEVFALDNEITRQETLGADLRAQDRANIRAQQRAKIAFANTYPEPAPTRDAASGQMQMPDADAYATYDAALAAHEADLARLDAEADALVRAMCGALIARCVVSVGGADVDAPAPDPQTPEDWAAWPTMLLRWIGADGRVLARESIRSQKSATPNPQLRRVG